MFTGIIENVGTVVEMDSRSSQGRLVLSPRSAWDDACQLGESIAVDGVCLTLAKQTEAGLCFDVLRETFECTNLGQRAPGDLVNLERAMPYGHRMGGHIVQGHIDGVGEFTRVDRQGDDIVLGIRADASLTAYFAYKGSVALNGISLTVARTTEDGFEVHIIPHTWDFTSLQQVSEGDAVNLEVDVIAKYTLRQLRLGVAPVPPEWEALTGETSDGV